MRGPGWGSRVVAVTGMDRSVRGTAPYGRGSVHGTAPCGRGSVRGTAPSGRGSVRGTAHWYAGRRERGENCR